MCSFGAKYILLVLKKYRGVIFHETEEAYKIWRGIALSIQNWHKEFGRFRPEHWKVSKVFTLMGSFWAMYILLLYRGVIFHDIEESCKIWRKTDLPFGKRHEESDRFSLEHSKVSKLEPWCDPFVQSRKCMTLKFTEEICVMKMKNDTKIEEELTLRFKIDMKNFTKFYPSTQKSKKFVLIGSLWP